jgi:CBS domain-containing protein
LKSTASPLAGVGLAARYGHFEVSHAFSEVMTPNVEVTRPDATLRQAAELMRDLDVGMVPVCDGERLVGTITDRDIVIRGVAAGCDVESTDVRELMSPDIVYCFEDQDTEEAADIMNVRQIRCLPILDRSKRRASSRW